jgi:hypothetical protein
MGTNICYHSYYRIFARGEFEENKTSNEFQVKLKKETKASFIIGRGIRTFIDTIDDSVNKAYATWATRLYFIEVDSRVTHRSGFGPFGFKPKEFREAIQKYLTK